MDGAQSTSRSENPFLIVLEPRTNDPLYGVVINLIVPLFIPGAGIGRATGGRRPIGRRPTETFRMKNMMRFIMIRKLFLILN